MIIERKKEDKTNKNKKIKLIEIFDKYGNSKHTWSAFNLHWDGLPKWLLNEIEMNFPKYRIEVEYFD